jgi:hypothetical protein
VCAYVCVCMYVCMHVCMYVCMYVCISVAMYLNLCYLRALYVCVCAKVQSVTQSDVCVCLGRDPAYVYMTHVSTILGVHVCVGVIALVTNELKNTT